MRRLIYLTACLMLSGCATTRSANITAYGVQAITPYGVINAGYINYQRTTGDSDQELKTPEVPKTTIQ